MKHDDLSPPPEIESILAKARPSFEVTPETEARYRAVIEEALARRDESTPDPSPSTERPDRTSGWPSKLAWMLLGTGIGAVLHARLAPPTPQPSPARVVIREVVREVRVPTLQEAVAPPPAPPTPPHVARTNPPRVAPNTPHDDDADRELFLAVRSAWLQGSNDTLALIERHRRSFPHSRFAEERDAIEIQHMAVLDRRAEANQRWEQFRSRYPTSVHRTRIESSLRFLP